MPKRFNCLAGQETAGTDKTAGNEKIARKEKSQRDTMEEEGETAT
jgi:hypothetical protein